MTPYRRWYMSLKQPFDTGWLAGTTGGDIGPKSAMGWCIRLGGGAGTDLSVKGIVAGIILAGAFATGADAAEPSEPQEWADTAERADHGASVERADPTVGGSVEHADPTDVASFERVGRGSVCG